MPNVGKPSKDCHLCRSRRVKCDLARPSCQRCIKYGAECPGYRDQQELVFRNADPNTVRKKKKRARREDVAPSSVSQSSASTTAASTPRAFSEDAFDSGISMTGSTELAVIGYDDDSTLCVPQSLHEHWTSHSIPILLNVYSTLDFINTTYQSRIDDGPLVWAAHLFSRTYVTNLRHSAAIHKDSVPETNQELGMYLGKTLKAVNEALRNPAGALRNDVLATVWILANYELLIGSINRDEIASPWHLHAHGLYSILKSRGPQSLRTAVGRMAFWPAFNMVQVQRLLSNQEPPAESDEWLRVIGETLIPEEVLGLQACLYINTVCRLQHRILKILYLRDVDAALSEYQTIISDIMNAKDEMDILIANRMQRELDMYMKMMYSSALVKGHHILQLLVNYVTHHTTSKAQLEELYDVRNRCLTIVQNAAQDILENIPYWFNAKTFRSNMSPKDLFDAMKLIWPLTAVYVISSTRPQQSCQAQAALAIIGKEIGIRQALKIHKGRLPLPSETDKPVQMDVSPNTGPGERTTLIT